MDKKCPKIWQYSGTGNIKGIDGNTDLNVINSPIWNN